MTKGTGYRIGDYPIIVVEMVVVGEATLLAIQMEHTEITTESDLEAQLMLLLDKNRINGRLGIRCKISEVLLDVLKILYFVTIVGKPIIAYYTTRKAHRCTTSTSRY